MPAEPISRSLTGGPTGNSGFRFGNNIPGALLDYTGAACAKVPHLCGYYLYFCADNNTVPQTGPLARKWLTNGSQPIVGGIAYSPDLLQWTVAKDVRRTHKFHVLFAVRLANLKGITIADRSGSRPGRIVGQFACVHQRRRDHTRRSRRAELLRGNYRYPWRLERHRHGLRGRTDGAVR